eukprot:g13459.t1
MGAACSEVEDAEAPERGAKSTSLEEWRRHRFEKNPEFCSFDQLARPLNVLRDGILARKDNEPVLLVGPVLGRVTDTSASFLVEVSEEIDVNISIVQVNGFRGPLDRHVYPMGTSQDFQQPSLVSLELDRTFFSPKSAVCCVQRLKPGMPVTFQLQNLLSDSPYMVFVSNIPDLELRNPLRFRTMPLRVERLRLVAIGDYAASNFGTMAGEDSEEGMDPWRELLKTVKAGAAEPHVALHLGRNSATHLFEEVMDSLKEHQSYCEGPKQTMLRRARDLLRESYRTTLGGHRQLRAILAQLCSNICVFMPPLELPKILEQIHELETKAKQTGAEVTLLLGDLHQLLCLALEVYQEYERAMYIVDAGEISDSVEEWHIHRYGSVTIMVLDTKGHAITAALTGTKSKQILSEKQWDAIEEVLADETDKGSKGSLEKGVGENAEDSGHVALNAIDMGLKGSLERGLGEDTENSGNAALSKIDKGSKGSLEKGFEEDNDHFGLNKGCEGSVGKDFVEDAADPDFALKEVSKLFKEALEEEVKQVDLPSAADEGVDSSLQSPLTWKDSRLEQETLLEKLFDWKKVQPSKREVVLLNGADFSSTGTLSDTRLDMSIPVVLAGVVEGHSRGHHPWKLDADLPGGRFKYSYEEPIMDHWGLPFLDITVTEDQVAVQISMVTGRRKQHVHAFPSTARAGRARGH